MRGAARVTILNARTFTGTAPADSCPSSAVRLPTVWLIAMAFCAGMKRDTRTIRTISSADDFTGSARRLNLDRSRRLFRRSPTSIVAGNRTEDGRNCHGRANGYEDHGQHRVAMPSIVIDVLHVCITNGCGCVSLAIAHDKVFITGAVNIALNFTPIVQRDCRARFRPDTEFRNAAFYVFEVFCFLARSENVCG